MNKKSKSKPNWRVVDIVISAVLGVACGVIFWTWSAIGKGWGDALNSLTPGLAGLVNGGWYIGGILGGLIVRKPGAAFFVEVLGGAIEALLGNSFGVTSIYCGVVQGIGAELVFALFLYRRFSPFIAGLAGAMSGVAGWLLELFLFGNSAKSMSFNVIYLITDVASGFFLAGILGWYLVKALARTGALDRFPVGQSLHREV